MSYPKNMYSIAMNLLLPPVSMKIPLVAGVMGIPYPTLYKWKRDALSSQGAKKSQGKSMTTSVRWNKSHRFKIKPSDSGSKSDRTRTSSVLKLGETRLESEVNGISESLAEDY